MTACPIERFATLAAAEQELTERRARATLAGSPPSIQRHAWWCVSCGHAHITRDSEKQPVLAGDHHP